MMGMHEATQQRSQHVKIGHTLHHSAVGSLHVHCWPLAEARWWVQHLHQSTPCSSCHDHAVDSSARAHQSTPCCQTKVCLVIKDRSSHPSFACCWFTVCMSCCVQVSQKSDANFFSVLNFSGLGCCCICVASDPSLKTLASTAAELKSGWGHV